MSDNILSEKNVNIASEQEIIGGQKQFQKQTIKKTSITQNIQCKQMQVETQVALSQQPILKSKKSSKIPSIYSQTIQKYQKFLSQFQQSIQSIYSKQCYRIYLNDNKNENELKQLIKEKNQLCQILQDSKDYKRSQNRKLIEEIMKLEELRNQYHTINHNYQNDINHRKTDIINKKIILADAEKQIKSYWIYNYDLTNTKSQKNCKNTNSHMDSINSRISQNVNKSRIQKGKSYQNSSLKTSCISSYAVHLPRLTTCPTLSKDLSLLNCSVTKQKLLQKVQSSNKRRIIEKIQYERQKLNLLQLFKIYLNQVKDNEKQIKRKTMVQRIVSSMQQTIQNKENIIKQIQKVLHS